MRLRIVKTKNTLQYAVIKDITKNGKSLFIDNTNIGDYIFRILEKDS